MSTVRIQLRRGLSSEWTSVNPTLAAGEVGIETDTNTLKFGDGTTAWSSLNYALSNTVDDYQPISEKGNAGGYASLDGSGYVPVSQLPPTVKITVNAVADQAARLALSVQAGDIAIQADNGTTYVLSSTPASNNSNWKEISATAAISAAITAHEADTTNVHGIANTSLLVTTTGTQALTNKTITSPTGLVKADVGLNSVDNTSDANKPVSTATRAAIDAHEADTTNIHGIADTTTLVTLNANQTLTAKTLASPALTGTPTAPTATVGTDTTQLATTAFVQDAIELVVGAAPAALNTLAEIATSLANNADLSGTLTTSISNKVAKAGDTMSGVLNMGTNKITSVGTATTDFDAANKFYVDARVTDTVTLQNTYTTNVHGISDTANLVYTADARLSNQRIPSNGSVTTVKVEDAAITTAKIADLAITGGKIATNAISQSHLSDDSVGTAEIGGLAVTTAKIAADAVTTAKIANAAVETAKVADLAVTTGKINDLAVTEGKVANLAVTTAKIADAAVTTAKITDLNVTEGKINTGAVTADKIGALAVTEGKIADNAVTSGKIANGTIVDADISGVAAIATSKISGLDTALGLKAPLASPTFTGTVTLPTGTVTSGMILDGTIVDSDVSATAAIAQSKISGLSTSLGLKADLASPTFTGTVSGITKSMVGLGSVDNTADTAKPVSTATQTALDLKLASATAATTYETISNVALKAPLASPALTGSPTAPTALAADNSTKIATTAYADRAASAAASALVASAPAALDTLNELAAALGNDASFSTTVTNSIATKAPLASPTFTGTVSGITKSMVGLANVDNTADTAKPVSTATQTALDLKLASATAATTYAPLASPTFTGTNTVANITVSGTSNMSANGVQFSDGTQTKVGVPSITTTTTTIGAAYNLSTGGLTLRDQRIQVSGAYAITIPTNTTTAFPVGTSISFWQSSGAGGASFVPADGTVSVYATPGATLRALYSSATITKVGANAWIVAGDLKA